jgi:hypothetical protein
MSEPISGAELLKRIRPQLAEESVNICLRPDLIETWTEANEALQELVADGMKGARLSSKPEGRKELAEQVQALEAEIEANSATFRFRALPKDRWRALCDDHPPRKGNEIDLYAGYDRDAVLDEAVRLSLIDPMFDNESWAEFTQVVNAGEWDELRKTVNSVNRGVVDAPKSALALRILTKPGDASRSPELGE